MKTLSKNTPILQNPIKKLNHFLLALFFSNEVFLTFIFLTNLNLFGLDHTKFSTGYPTLHTNFFHQMVLQYMFKETTQSLVTQKNHFCTHIYVISCPSQTQPNLKFQTQVTVILVTPPLLIPINLNPTKIH